jgi:hypothetical protein
MRESDLCAVNDTITDSLEDDEKRLVLGVEDEVLEGGLFGKTLRQRVCGRVVPAVL